MLIIFILFLLALIMSMLLKYIRNERRCWKFYKKSYNKIIYSEKIKGNWQSIKIDAKIDYGTFLPMEVLDMPPLALVCN